ncbi:MAG: hypothetical protein F6K36_27530 [Symploca sp. SIO3C6]|uniref:Uncharacterized protein n=1 Tax=Symploca sp. SIO1C4 TaxID=2607765 RepID=A0A6B3N720_9CYAN|nr:hypothetical protein [Symploca sp. SIO3C6]NEO99118.1 hypothetical protein [Symploca sp. SIO2E9]NER26412.1 hypothetical protein [Symploca sp. SIO1C4]NET07849.1 hypothetical protein [Symploca sp. SIO2B6]NET47597.1 hypothetical protein [Merismopedia sp. SIO2A8]
MNSQATKVPYETPPENIPAASLSRRPTSTQRSFKKGRLILMAGGVVGIIMLITALVVNNPATTRRMTEKEIAIARKNAAYQEYLEHLTRVDLSPDTLKNAGILQQQVALLSVEIQRDVATLRNREGHPSFRLTEAGALHQQTMMVNKLAWLAQRGTNARLTYHDGVEEVTLAIPPTELASIAYIRLWAIATAENITTQPRYNTQLTMTQLVSRQQQYKKQQQDMLRVLGLLDAVTQIDGINSNLLEEEEKSRERLAEHHSWQKVLSGEGE